jgi:glycosyltransferase involved in cell wall biosynthesis
VKILVITDFYPPYYVGGYELVCCDQVEELVRRGHNVTVLTSQWQAGRGSSGGNAFRLLRFIDPYEPSDDLAGGLLSSLRLKRRRRQLRMGIVTRQNKKIAGQIISNYQPDVVFAWNMNSIGIGPVVAAQQAGIPVVFSLLDYWLADLKATFGISSGPIKRWYHALLNGLGDFGWLDVRHLIAASQAVQSMHLDRGFPIEHLRLIYPGLPSAVILAHDELAAPVEADERHLKLLFAGRLVPEKGLEVALQALARVEQGHVSLDIIGDGPAVYRLHLQQMVTALDLRNLVHFVGPLRRERVFERYAAFDILLVPSLWVEPFGMIVVEAMARGLAVIAANHGGPAEIITHGRDGVLVPPGDPVALAEAITELAHDPHRVYQMRIQAVRMVRERYTLEACTDRVEAYLQETLKESLVS